MPSTAISAQGSKFYIGTGTGGAKTISAVTVGNPTIVTATAHGFSNGDVVTLAGFTGADAATLNGQTVVVKNVTTNTFAFDIDTTGKTITIGTVTATPVTWTQIKNLKSFTGLDGSPSDIDITNLDSTAKEYTPGLVDNGMFSGEVDRDQSDAGQLAFDAARVAGTTKNFKLVFPSSVATATFSGYVKKFGLAGGVDQVLKTPFDIRITGAVSWS
jgi:hypothetical protein